MAVNLLHGSANASQSLNFSGEAYVSKVTGKLVNAKQDAKGQWIVDSSNTATQKSLGRQRAVHLVK
nr:hypothetical protein [Lactobacillus johnsonii]